MSTRKDNGFKRKMPTGISGRNTMNHVEPEVNRPIFYPRPTTAKPTLIVDVEGAQLGCHVQRPYPDAGMMVYFHGNGECAAECELYLADYYLEMGVNICFVEYRGYGASTGEPKMVAMMDDGEKVVAALGLPAEKVVAFGRSLGSMFAVELARRLPNIAGVILESGIADFFERFALVSDEQSTDMFPLLDQRAKLTAYQGPLLVLHAQHDRLVEASHGIRLHSYVGGTDKRLVLFDKGDHNSILPMNSPAYAKEVQQFLKRVGITQRNLE
jgi:pimeloyl-ACP methyl ester carboxylesterase